MYWQMIKQRAKMESGPVCILNVAKSLDLNLSYAKYSKIVRRLCNYDQKYGVKTDDFDIAIRSVVQWLADIKYYHNPTPNFVKRLVMEADTVCVPIKWKNPKTEIEQYSLITSMYSDIFQIVNYSKSGTTTQGVKFEELKNMWSIYPQETHSWSIKEK